MLKIFTGKNIMDDKSTVDPCDDFTFNHIYNNINLESPEVKNIINIVEGTKLDEAGNLISKFNKNTININKLSDGCKAVLYCYWSLNNNTDKIIDATECGSNAIKYILEHYNNSNLTLYIGHIEFPSNVSADFLLNNELCHNTNELFN